MGAKVIAHVNTRPITLPARYEVKVTSDPAHLASVRKAVEALAAAAGFGDCDVGEIGLCLNEAMANIIRHAYAGKTDRPIQLGALVTGDGITIELRD